MEWFSRENLYDFPRVTVSSFVSEIDIQETKVLLIVTNFYNTPIWYPERELLNFSHDHLFEMKFRSLKKHYLPQIVSPKILRTKLWNFLMNFLRISASHHTNFRFWTFVEKNVIAKIPRWPVYIKLRNLQNDLTSTDHISKNIANQALNFFISPSYPKNFHFWNFEEKEL